MKLRATCTYPDGVPPSIEEWPDAYRDVDDANKWLDVMRRLHNCGIEIAQLCDEHGEEDVTTCDDCGWPMCAVEAEASRSGWDANLCEGCMETRREDAECWCPGGQEHGPCGCPACIGGGRTGRGPAHPD
jgi:hypothetical protein